MKFDMHCHTKEGSLDGRVGIEDYIRILRDKGFQGMLVTDHNSYDGYRSWKKERENRKDEDDFIVLKGIEYDTINAGGDAGRNQASYSGGERDAGVFADYNRPCLWGNPGSGASLRRKIHELWRDEAF